MALLGSLHDESRRRQECGSARVRKLASARMKTTMRELSNSEFKQGLEKRTLDFAVEVVRFVAGLKYNSVNAVLGRQLLSSATSIGANYREANRAESRADFIHKIGLVEKEASETVYWLDLFSEVDSRDGNSRPILARLGTEALELLKLFTAISKRTKK